MEDELMDIGEVCRRLGGTKPLNAATVYRAVKAGKLPRPITVTTGARRWRRSDIEAAIAPKSEERAA
jgi:predicted DNA-binding transcriptional regulator AlpA